ncbi:MAG: hypothetical protein RLZZ293_1554 [Pseudomonadota bacterium]|jgi:hypothetical protein
MKNTSYQSEATQFINTLLTKPGNHQQQMQLRSTWWDKDFIDEQEQQEYAQAKVPHQAYSYFSYSKQK